MFCSSGNSDISIKWTIIWYFEIVEYFDIVIKCKIIHSGHPFKPRIQYLHLVD